MKLYIKNMVCDRCKMVVEDILQKNNLSPVTVELGEVTLKEEVFAESQKKQVADHLAALGFDLIDDKKSQLIEQVKNLIIQIVHYDNGELKTNLSDFLSNKLQHDYNYISNLFSEVENSTIEKYFIFQKIEKVKELIHYNELSLSEIAHKLHYSSVAHLSNQFKKITGFTPSEYKKIQKNKRRPLDEI